MPIRILHVADCHLGYTPTWLGADSERPLAKQRAADFGRTFQRIVDMACDPANAIDLVVIAGDLFDRHDPDPRRVAETSRQLERLVQRPLPVILVPGNHDSVGYASSIYRRDNFSGVTVVNCPQVEQVAQLTVRDETVHVYSVAQDLTRGVDTHETMRRTDEPGIHVAVLHASVWSNPAWDLKDEDFPLRPEAIARSGMQYVALGHFHNYEIYNEGGVTAVYPGSTEGKDFGECGPRFVVIAEVTETGVDIERRECHTRELREVTLDLGEQPVEDEAAIAERLHDLRSDALLIRLRLTGPAEFVPDTEAIRRRLEGAFFYVEVLDETRLVDGALVRSLRDENTIRGLFVRKMLDRIKSAEDAEREQAELALKLGLDEFLKHTAG